jgi:hypothetical protein
VAQDLQAFVVKELQIRKGDWPAIARAVEGMSYSFISKLGRGVYPGSPTYKRLRALADYFQANPLPAGGAAPQSASHSSIHTAADTAAGIPTA